MARRSATSCSIHSAAAPAGPSARTSSSGRRQVAEAAQQVVQLVGRAGPAVLDEALQLELEVGQHLGVDQLAQLLGAEQLAQQVTVERQRGGPALGQRRVALVHVGGDPVEQQALGERRRLLRVDADQPDLAAAQVGQDRAQGGHVEHVLQALPAGLQQDREGGVLGRHRQQVGGPLALLPQRACGSRAGGGAAAAPGPRTPGSGTRTAAWTGSVAEHQLVDLVGSIRSSSAGISSAASGRRITMPSSLHMVSTAMS